MSVLDKILNEYSYRVTNDGIESEIFGTFQTKRVGGKVCTRKKAFCVGCCVIEEHNLTPINIVNKPSVRAMQP